MSYYVYMYLRSKRSKNGEIGSPYYVGKGKGMRAYDKDHRCKPPLDRNRIVFVSRNMCETDAHQLEMLLIYFYGRIDIGTGCLGNLTDGGEGFRGKHSHETRLKMSQSRKGHSPAIFSEETKKEISRKLKDGGFAIGNKHALGHRHSEETRAKMKGRTPHNRCSFEVEQKVIAMKDINSKIIAERTGICRNTVYRILKGSV